MPFKTSSTTLLLATAALSVVLGCGPRKQSVTSSQAPRANEAIKRPKAGSIEQVQLKNTPFEPHPTMFKPLDSKTLGIDFVHVWNPPSKFYMQIHSYACTVGAAIGDYDSDGHPDIFFANQKDGGKLYRNLGNWRFQDVTKSAGVLAHGMWGTGVSFVDVNNDSHLDLFLCGFKSANRLFVNQGNGTFLEMAKSYGLDYDGASTMMSFSDYDRDGDLDAYLLTNRMPPEKYLTGKATRVNGQVVVPDHLLEDKGVINLSNGEFRFMAAGQFDYMFRNNGDETFSDITAEVDMDRRNHHGLSAIWWDPNRDGWPDLYVANDFTWPDHFYVNNGTRPRPTFTDVVKTAMPHVPWFSMGSDIGDFNADGLLDLIATDMAPTSHYRSKLTMGDMSTLGWFLDEANPKQYMRNALFLNTGTDRFQEAAQMAGVANSDWTWSVRAEDFDCDGLLDLFMTTGMTRDFENTDLSEELKQLQTSAKTDTERVLVATRFWRDKPQRKEPNVAFRNRGNLSFEPIAKVWGLDETSVGFGCATGDLDGDGDLDIVVNNFSSSPSVYRNLVAENSDGSANRLKIKLRGRASNSHGIGARVELTAGGVKQMRYLTLARGYMSSSQQAVFFGVGKHRNIESVVIHWPSGVRQEVANLTANHCYTITEPDMSNQGSSAAEPSPMFVESSIVAGIRHREKPFDDFARQPLLPNRLSQYGPGLSWGDINGDGVDDLYLGGAHGEPGRPHLLKDDQFIIFTKRLQAFIEDANCEDMGSLFLDADSDGDLDLFVVSGGIECEPDSKTLGDRLYLNDGGGRFSKAIGAIPDLRISGSCVAGADFDHDGDVDLFVGGRTIPGEYPLAPPSYVLENQSENGTAKFVDVTSQVAPGLANSKMVTSATWSDIDNDRWLDLLITQEWGTVRLFQNNGGKLIEATEEAGLAGRLGWFNGIHGGDVDHDGDIDFVVTNFGFNTKYQASSEEPLSLYYGDLDGSSKKRIVEAAHKDSRLLPVRGKSCSQNAMPFLRSKFPTYHEFALQSLDGIYSPTRLNDSYRLQANELGCGLLLNDGNGRFQWRLMPRIAQLSPGFGVTLSDLNLDGHLDILIAQNFFGPQRETGRMSGGVGQLLIGDGLGNFRPVSPASSGIVLPDDAKGLTVVHLNDDKKPDVVFSVNNGPIRAFLNQAETSAKLLNVSLKGPPGNPTAVGARIEVISSNGDVQVVEQYAGAGYLSQSTSKQTFAVHPQFDHRVVVYWPNGKRSEFLVSNNLDVSISSP